MNTAYTVTARTVADILAVRAQVRDLARAAGLAITDQARISLATSSLADVLGVGTQRPGEITVDFLGEDGERPGIRVVCTAGREARRGLTQAQLDVHRMMVDELAVETLPSGDVRVVMVQWSPERSAA